LRKNFQNKQLSLNKLLWDRLDKLKSVASTLSWTILLIDALNYKMMTCLKLMPWMDLTTNKRDMTHFPINTTQVERPPEPEVWLVLKLIVFSALCS
jgi:hypothetical protein